VFCFLNGLGDLGALGGGNLPYIGGAGLKPICGLIGDLFYKIGFYISGVISAFSIS